MLMMKPEQNHTRLIYQIQLADFWVIARIYH